MKTKWSKIPLGDVIKIASGQVDPREAPYCDMIHVGGDNIESHTGRLQNLRTAGEQRLISGKYQFDQRDVLYSKIRPALNKVVAPDFEGICSADIYPLRPINGNLCKEYLVHLLRSDDFLEYTRTCSSRTNIPKINREALFAFQVLLPPLSEQHRIAAILDKTDAIRRKREEGIRLTEELLRSTFLEMFGDPVDHASLPLVEVAEVVSGVAKGRKLKGRAVEVPYLRVANVQDGFLDLAEIKTIEAMPEEVESLSLIQGDIVLTEGGDHDKLGRGAIWYQQLTPCIHQNHIFRVRVNHGRLLPEFFAAFLRTREAKAYFLRCAKKTTNLASINMTQLKGLPVPIPPIDLQSEFKNSISTIVKASNARKRTVEENEQLFGSLVQRAFRGEL